MILMHGRASEVALLELFRSRSDVRTKVCNMAAIATHLLSLDEGRRCVSVAPASHVAVVFASLSFVRCCCSLLQHPQMYSNMAAHVGMQYRAWVNPDDSKNSELETEVDIAAIIHIVQELVQQQELKREQGQSSKRALPDKTNN